MNHNYSITNDSISLKPMNINDAENYRILRNNVIHTKCFNYSKYITKEQQLEWYNNYLQNTNDIMLSAYANEQFIGGNSLFNIDWETGVAEYGRLIVNPKYSGNSYGYQMTIAALKIAKEQLSLNKVFLEVYNYNLKALNVYKKAGFNINESNNHDNLTYMEILL